MSMLDGLFSVARAAVSRLSYAGGAYDKQQNIAPYYSTEGDGGEGVFEWRGLSTTTADGGTVVAVSGVTVGRWHRLYAGAINVKWFGAKGDATTDDYASIVAAVTATPVGGQIYFPPAATGYAVSAGVTIPVSRHVNMEAPLIYTGSSNITILTIGTAGLGNIGPRLKIGTYRSTLSAWTSESNIAIKIINANTGDINIFQADRCTIGVQALGDAQGVAYTRFKMGRMNSNKIGLDLRAANSGWVNENEFVGGRWSVDSGNNRALSRYGVRFSHDGTYANNNNNVFQKPSFELNYANQTAGEAVPILIEAGVENRFIRCRFEGNSTTAVRLTGASTENHVDSGYGIFDRASIDDQSTYPVTSIESSRYMLQRSAPMALVFDSGPVAKTVCHYDAIPTFHCPNLIGVPVGGTAVAYFAGASIGTDYLEIAATGIGRWVSTTLSKRFVVRRDVTSSSYGGRIVVRCFDSGGVLLTDGGGGHPYVKTASLATVSYGSTGGGGYKTGSDSDSDVVFTVGSDVKSIQVLMFGGTANLRLKSFKLFTLDVYDCASWVDYEQCEPGSNIGTAAPASGTWVRGRRIINAAPSSGGTEGWVCTASGTPGTWKAFGVIA